MIKTIIFDLGQVIISYDHKRIINRLRQISGPASGEPVDDLFRSDHIRRFDTGQISAAEFFAIISDLHDLKIAFDEFAGIWNSTFLAEPIISESLITGLAENYQLLVLSDTNPLHFEFLVRGYPILRHFNEFVLSFQAGYLKPSREIFAAAVEKAGCAPGECLFTDDRAANVAGAIEAGLKAVEFVSQGQFEADLARLGLI